jgi:hypothetical protein
MKPLTLVLPMCLGMLACGGSSFTQSNNDGGTLPTDGGVTNNGDAGSDAGTDAGDAGLFDGGLPIDAMPPVSFGKPASASSSTNSTAATANSFSSQPTSTVAGTCWISASLPATIAYDLSSVASANRQAMLAAWYSLHVPDYITSGFVAADDVPIDYTIELNIAAGGGAAPSTGWTVVETVTNNDRSGRMFTLNMNGTNWIRMNISRGSSSNNACINMDIYSAPAGGTDSWLFLGDSITHITMVRAFSDLPGLVHAAQPDRWPAILEGAVGGTNTVTTQPTFDAQLANFPGRFVVLAFGTNDDPNNFQMEALVLKVLAVGKTPVIPLMPWAPDTTHQTNATQFINPAIQALYTKYPQIIKGPDLYSFFSTHQSDIPAGDIHPNTQGQEDLRGQWAITIESVGQ